MLHFIATLAFCAVALVCLQTPALAQGSGKYERTQPAAPPPTPATKPAVPKPPTPARPLPIEKQPLVVELIRKAEANEAENGFCATTSWPLRSRAEGMGPTFVAFLDQAGVGSGMAAFIVYETSVRRCSFRRVDSVYAEGERRCVQLRLWDCTVGKKCEHDGAFKICKTQGGSWVAQ